MSSTRVFISATGRLSARSRSLNIVTTLQRVQGCTAIFWPPSESRFCVQVDETRELLFWTPQTQQQHTLRLERLARLGER